MSNQDLFIKIDKYREAIQNVRPLEPTELRQLDEYFKIGLTYSSNALEGSTLTLSETKILLEDGLTVGGKPIKDYLEATGHAKAYDVMLEIARANPLVLTEEQIKRLHYLFFVGIDSENAGKYRNRQVFISGTEYLPPKALKVPEKMHSFVTNANQWLIDRHPVEAAILIHKCLVDIHPFIDGNGRTARLLMNLVLVNKGYGVVCISPVLRNDYIHALMAAQRKNNPDIKPFEQLIAECVLETQRDYCRLLRIKPVILQGS